MTLAVDSSNPEQLLLGSIFEDNYLRRTHKTLTTNYVIALTELVANAWDSGASYVKITLPEGEKTEISVEDDGIGMSDEEFMERWMTLSYNRLEHQGKNVVFPDEQTSVKRTAFGRNGVGRHGMLCFCDSYTVTTKKGRQENSYKISATSKSQALTVERINQRILSADAHGTIIIGSVERNFPNPDKLLEELAKRFIADPSFSVVVNGKTIENSDLMQEAPTEIIEIPNGEDTIKIEIILIDTEKAHKKSLYQGVAFWQTGRLVGEPSWTIGKHAILDGRTQWAKRYTFIVRSNDFEKFIKEDWTGFQDSPVMDNVYDLVAEKIEQLMGDLNLKNIQSIKSTIKQEHAEEIKQLSRVGKQEIDEVITQMVVTKPGITNEALSTAVSAVIKIEKTRSGSELLQKLTSLNPDEIDALNRLLDDWSIKDALSVLDEIDKRLTVIAAITKLHHDKDTDELHTLHPLITAARWVFGPEFDSPEYSANHQLRILAKQIFKVEDANFMDGIKRPDLIVKGDSTIGFSATEDFTNDEVSYLGRILLIELKRGGFKITREERNQAQGYVEQLFESNTLTANTKVTAFVVGDAVENESIRQTKVCDDRGIIHVITFAQVVDTANRRLFRLRDILSARYEKYTGTELAEKAMQLQLSM